ncbi:unnamed protein product [Timema podura]|uniref:Uncharacterized protein n=1 Tax=Timema podura TaxID=61482 RepID=A0ABN7P7M2_TIMPD|nr:unnamed protein product [Timema podura]
MVISEGENGVGSLNGQVHSFDSAAGPSQEDSRLLQFLDKLTGPGGESQQPTEELTLVQRVLSLRLHIAALAVLVSWLTFWDYDFLFAQEVVLRVSHAFLMSSDRIKPRSGD